MKDEVLLAKKYGDISLAKYLSRFVSLNGRDLRKVTHDEVRLLFPNIRRASIAEVKKNPSLICTGEVILVDDGRNIVPYYIPQERCENIESEFIREEVKKDKIDDTVYDYANMSIYELRCLLKRKFNSYRNQACAKMELGRRGIVLHKKYKRSEEKKKGLE